MRPVCSAKKLANTEKPGLSAGLFYMKPCPRSFEVSDQVASPLPVSAIWNGWLMTTIRGLYMRPRSVAWNVANVVGNIGFDHWLDFDHCSASLNGTV